MLLAFLNKVPADDVQGLARLVAACATGWQAAFTQAGEMLATLAALVLAFHAGVTRDAARIVIPAIQAVASLEAVADPIPLIRLRLVMILTDLSGEFCMSELEAIRLIDSALQDFV